MPFYEPFDWYETPVYYDIIFDTDTKREAAFLEQCHHLNSTAKPEAGVPLHVLEPACGNGRLMAELAVRGHRVAGVDLSPGMLEFARNRFKQREVCGELLEAPMQEFDLHAFSRSQCKGDRGGFDLAHILVSSFKYLQTEEDAANCLRCVCDHLRLGGVFVLGLHLTEPDQDERSLERWRAKRDGLDVICTIRGAPPDHAARTEEVRSRIIVRNNSWEQPKRYQTDWIFRTYTPEQLRSLLQKEQRLKHCATYTFDHDVALQTSLDGDYLGVILVLRREH